MIESLAYTDGCDVDDVDAGCGVAV